MRARVSTPTARRSVGRIASNPDKPEAPFLRHEIRLNALDQAAALQGWDLPEVFQHLRHLLEARMGNRGKREFIQVLRLLEAISLEVVTFAVTEAIALGAIGFDAVKLIALARIERRPARLNLSAYPHLPKTTVRTTSAADYAVLLPEEAA
jgi:hypothetical protein